MLNAPAGFESDLQPLPEGVVHQLAFNGQADVILSFHTQRADLASRFKQLAVQLDPAGGLWVVWPKKSSGLATDLNENVIRDIGLAEGLVDVKVCAVTEVWSGLRFVYRLKDRPKARS